MLDRFWRRAWLAFVLQWVGCASTSAHRPDVNSNGKAPPSYEDAAASLKECGRVGNGYINKGVPGLGTELFGCSMMARCGRLVEPGKARSPGVGEGYVGLECARSSCVCSINLDVFDVQLERKIDIEGNCVSKEQIVDVMKRQCGFRFDSSVTSAEE